MGTCKVMVVDDSALMRRLLTQLLRDAGHEVVTARNGKEAVEILLAEQPDVVTLDINMPEMDGLTALSLIMAARPTPVIMVSSLTARGALATMEALALGAVDFIAKPGGTISLSIDEIRTQLLDKIQGARRARMKPARLSRALAQAPERQPLAPSSAALRAGNDARQERLQPAPARLAGALTQVVLIGVSTGGPRTLEDILPPLPASFPWPIVVAQHMPGNFTSAFAERLNQQCALTVREVSETMPLERGHAYIGRGGHDVIVAERLGRLVVTLRPESPEHLWHPSVDMLVDSAMKVLAPNRLIGVQLTGMGYDGARAMTELHRAGGRTIAESSETAVVFGMPMELIERGGAGVVLPCHEIAGQLLKWAR
ncbi:two-component system chemotaxis response regulator CheB [Sphaerotilus hippei]|uniref:Protein-glutamate methylesterase/protein-glutamine glutaminase n=1 Tax=Sphaerotilus hippei TaxID=744406 RepID=A0A318H370_9BURK|nr:chemotaxis response regulator protein-glutamate methylesterase [Sphaerotilus hippei]PXW98005.1 two-component system chemotaxis response regulator CheB [Sphaerotilus hippei]